jgi:hypothetical protein
MINFAPHSIADAYVRPARNVALPSMPGRQVKFLQGHAVIKDGRDLVAMMRRPEVTIIMTPYALSWLETFLHEAGDKIRAEVQWPERATDDKPLANWDPSYRGTDRPDART